MNQTQRRPGNGEHAALSAAVGGDESAFAMLIRPHRPELAAHCYRMLGSVHDAEDVLQDVLVRAWQHLDTFAQRSSLRTWLFRIATNTCLNAIDSRARRWLPVDLAADADPTAEVHWLEALPDGDLDSPRLPDARYEVKESVELAFVAALQHLPARQRAALVLRDVLGFSARETAELLDTTTAAVTSALQHARARVRSRMPEENQQQSLRKLGDDRLRELVDSYVRAFEAGDVTALVELLTEDATWSMPPSAATYRGRQEIRDFLVRAPLTERWRHLRTSANGQPALACYSWNEQTGRYDAAVIDVLSVRDGRISAVTAFLDPSAFARFGLPASVDAPPQA